MRITYPAQLKNIASKSSRRFLIVALIVTIGVIFIIGGALAARMRKVTGFATTPQVGLFKPVVMPSGANGISRAVRDLPKAQPVARREFESELPPVKPNRPVPSGFVDPAIHPSLAAALAMPTPMANFEGQSSIDSAGGDVTGCLCIPPDTNGAVGPSQYVQMVNSAFSVYSKSGTKLSGPTQINSLFSTLPATARCRIDNNGDPVVVYDQLADRWLVSQFAVNAANNASGPYDECIAISKGPDATGQYYIYDFPLSVTKFEDYPHFGLWPDGYYMATHQFDSVSLNYVGAAAWAFERDKMLAGLPAQLIYFDLGTVNPAFGGHLPANLDGFTLPPAGAPNYFAEVDAATDIPPLASLRIWKFHVDWTTPANSTFGLAGQPNSVSTVTNFARPNCTNYASGCVPQLGDSFQLDPIGDRLMYRVAYRNFGDHESLVLNHTVVADATTGQMGPRWYEVRNPGGVAPTIFQQSTLGPSGPTDLYRWMSSIGMDHAGDIAIGYSTSSLTAFPSLAYSGRLAGDSVNTLAQGESQLFAGTGAQHGQIFAPQFGRWGDYSDLTVDPIDDCTFWYTNEYYASADAGIGIWHTRIGSFKFPSCTPIPKGLLTGIVTESGSGNPIAGATVTANGYTAISSASGVYQFSPLAPGTYTATASATGYFSSSTSVTITDGGTTTQNFVLTRNLAEPTPTPTPPPPPSQLVNPPVLNDPGGTINTHNYNVTWSAAEVTTGLASYVIEESTDYVNPLADNADGTAMPGDAASLWTAGDSMDPWTQDPAYHSSVPNSYFVNGRVDGFDTSLTLKNAITIPGTVGSGRLTFNSRYFNDPDDSGNVELSSNGGTSWTSLRILNAAPTTPPADTRMQNHEIDLTPYKGMPIKLRYRFNTGGLTYFLITTLGWWVDDINVDGGTWTQVGTVGPGTTTFPITNKPNGHYYYRVRAVYSNGTSTNNSNVQDIVVNAPAVCTPVNVALASNGSTAVASSTTTVRDYSPANAINGDRKAANWESGGGGWNDETRDEYPDNLEVDFSASNTINEIRVYTVQNDYRNPVEPDVNTPADVYGILDFDVQYWDGSAWVTVPGGSVTGNDKAMRVFTFANIATTKIRVVINNSRVHFSRITELEAFGCPSP